MLQKKRYSPAGGVKLTWVVQGPEHVSLSSTPGMLTPMLCITARSTLRMVSVTRPPAGTLTVAGDIARFFASITTLTGAAVAGAAGAVAAAGGAGAGVGGLGGATGDEATVAAGTAGHVAPACER